MACSVLERPAPPAPVKAPGHTKPYRVEGTWYQPLSHARDFEETGLASWYGRKFHGRKTSNGEIYDMHAISAAHKTLPMGTFVRVHNLNNGRALDVRINDRGPFVRGRIIDLSYAAAERLGVVGPGTAPVRITALGAPAPGQDSDAAPRYNPLDYYTGNFTFQVGAFTERANAERLVRQLGGIYQNAHMVAYVDGRDTFYRVRVGRVTDLEEAAQFERSLQRGGFPETFIVAE
ncbi:MAG: septal ring lytic transglycosylase RlpA family protein [Desulfatitalea sp.]|nr:septal ring lytic transglycosylase RlpA family protein [Desulfatitalea sp.]